MGSFAEGPLVSFLHIQMMHVHIKATRQAELPKEGPCRSRLTSSRGSFMLIYVSGGGFVFPLKTKNNHLRLFFFLKKKGSVIESFFCSPFLKSDYCLTREL